MIPAIIAALGPEVAAALATLGPQATALMAEMGVGSATGAAASALGGTATAATAATGAAGTTTAAALTGAAGTTVAPVAQAAASAAMPGAAPAAQAAAGETTSTASKVVQELASDAVKNLAGGGGGGGKKPPRKKSAASSSDDDGGGDDDAVPQDRSWRRIRNLFSHGNAAHGQQSYYGTGFGGPNFSGAASSIGSLPGMGKSAQPIIDSYAGLAGFAFGSVNAGAGGGQAGNALATGASNAIGIAGDMAKTPQNIAQDIPKLLVEVGKMPHLIKDWGKELLESKRYLADFNGQLAMTFAESERRDILRAIGAGEATSGTTSNLAEALNDLKDDIQPMMNGMSNALNRVATVLVRGVDLAAKFVNFAYSVWSKVDPLASWALGWIAGPDTDAETSKIFNEFIRAGASGELKKPYTRRPRE